jgi:phosphopantetheinyl transferase (holo-ACP synthase)
MHTFLLGCGVDAERIERFRELADQADPMPMVFSEAEVSHNQTLPDPAVGFCASFCCKEAFYKAVDTPFNFPDCEFSYHPADNDHVLTLSPDLQKEIGIVDARVRILPSVISGTDPCKDEKAELVALVNVFGSK